MAIICDVCGGELMIGAGGQSAKCVVCGVAYSIERIREKVKENQDDKQINKEKRCLIFSAKNMNWGQISRMPGTWRNTEYKVYSDGSIWSKADFSSDDPYFFWGKLSQPVEEQMKPELFKELKQILNREFEKAQTSDACDGEGWEMISYEIDGSEWHKISGYIYGVPVLERIEQLLKKNGEKTCSEENSREEDFVFRTEFNEEFQDYEEILVEYVGQASTIVIPEKTAILGEIEGKKSIFRYPETVKKVIIGKYVHIIGDYAFRGCKNLEEIHIPENVGYLWYSCGEEVNTEDDIAMNDCSHIFEGCTGLKKVVFDKNAWQGEDICDTLFKGCSSLKHVELPETMQWIGRYMFEDCVELEEIVIPDSVATIGQYAFKNCRKLKRVVLPNHPLAIHPTAFTGTLYKPPVQYTTGFNVNRCCVCGGKLNWGSQCKKCGRQIIYSGNKKDWV